MIFGAGGGGGGGGGSSSSSSSSRVGDVPSGGNSKSSICSCVWLSGRSCSGGGSGK